MEVLLVLLVITMGSSLIRRAGSEAPEVVRFKAVAHQKQAAPRETKAEESKLVKPPPPEKPEEKQAPKPPQPKLQPPPPKVIPLSPKQMATANIVPQRPSPPPPPATTTTTTGKKFGPPDLVGAPRDSAVVGTAPTGERLYAASWYREPYEDELSGYLSTASGPGWGLIACRTAPDFRVEDCVPVEEHPTGSNINRAILAAAWQFRVRPPRVDGKLKIGEWVRIRITYGLKQQ